MHPALRQLSQAVYPAVCEICDAPISDGRVICDACLDTGERIRPPFCRVCGEGFVGEMSVFFRCSNCGDRTFDFDFAVAAWRFSGPVRLMLLALKYGGRSYLRRVLAELMLPVFEDDRLADLLGERWKIVPVPLNARKLREREYNQSMEIATILGEKTGYAVVDALRRTRYTPSQARLTRKQRMENIEGAFAVRRWARGLRSLRGAPVFLLDDVFTTGATAQECARILRGDAGAERVVVLTVARG